METSITHYPRNGRSQSRLSLVRLCRSPRPSPLRPRSPPLPHVFSSQPRITLLRLTNAPGLILDSSRFLPNHTGDDNMGAYDGECLTTAPSR